MVIFMTKILHVTNRSPIKPFINLKGMDLILLKQQHRYAFHHIRLNLSTDSTGKLKTPGGILVF